LIKFLSYKMAILNNKLLAVSTYILPIGVYRSVQFDKLIPYNAL